MVIEHSARRESLYEVRKFVTYDFVYDVPRLHARVYTFHGSGCVQRFLIDGASITFEHDNQCGRFTLTKNLSEHLRAGTHAVHIEMNGISEEPWMYFTISPRDPLYFGGMFMVIIAILPYLFYFARGRLRRLMAGGIVLPLALGGMVRLVYFLSTDMYTRSYDVHGHVEYMTYVADNLALPDPFSGWSFFHPPLYYVLSGLWMRFQELFGREGVDVLHDIRWASFFLSIATLFVGLKAIRIATASDRSGITRTIAGIIFVTVPGFVMFSSRINNDVVSTFFSVLTMYLLLRWWQSKGTKHWYWAMAVLGLNILTKSTAIMFFPVALILLAVRYRTRLKRALLPLASLIPLIALVVWVNGIRLDAGSTRQHLVGNIENLNQKLDYTSFGDIFLVFRPITVVTRPFAGMNDPVENRHFWEFLFHTLHFGEFNYSLTMLTIGRIVSALGIAFIVFAFAGVVRDVRGKRFMSLLPFFVISVVCLALHMITRITFPHVPTQDFRYITFLAIPLAYFAARGVEWLPRRFIAAGRAWAALFILCSIAFIVVLSYEG